MNTLVATPQSITEDQFTDTTWLRYFDPKQALADLHAHIGTLQSDKTPEQHTRKSYQRGIRYFIKWAGGLSLKLPTESLINQYIAHLLHEKEWQKGKTTQYGVSATTVANAYLAPLRIFLRKLASQHIPATGHEREFIADCKAHIKSALSVKNPPANTKTNIAPLWNPKFVRLNINQVNLVLQSFDRDTITGARNYALLRIAFESALRVAEIQRITPDTISLNDDHALISVRGKRGNIDPVAVSPDCHHAIQHYILLYNEPIADDDPRRITSSTPIFQPMRKGNNHPEMDGIYDPSTGLSKSSIRDIIYQSTGDVLGDEFACKPHDCRRTFAYIAFTQGMDLTEISKALRHADAAITWKYIGTKPDYNGTLLSNFVQIA